MENFFTLVYILVIINLLIATSFIVGYSIYMAFQIVRQFVHYISRCIEYQKHIKKGEKPIRLRNGRVIWHDPKIKHSTFHLRQDEAQEEIKRDNSRQKVELRGAIPKRATTEELRRFFEEG